VLAIRKRYLWATFIFFVVLAAGTSTVRGQNTVTVNPTTSSLGQSLTVTLSINISNFQSAGKVTQDGNATCYLDDTDSNIGELSTVTVSATELTATGTINTSSIGAGTFSMSCEINYYYTPITGSEVTENAYAQSDDFTVNGTGNCGGTEGKAVVQQPPASGGDDTPTYIASITLPYTTNPGTTADAYPTGMQGVSDTSPYVDCESDRIYGTATAPLVENSTVEPEANGYGTVTFSWNIIQYRWPNNDDGTLQYCTCTGCDSSDCTTSGIENTEVVSATPMESYLFTQPANCSSTSGQIGNSFPSSTMISMNKISIKPFLCYVPKTYRMAGILSDEVHVR
jgi:hypothetical protein